MSRFKSAVHNIGHHAVSGLSDFLQEAYGACELNDIWDFEVDLMSGICTPNELIFHEPFTNAVAILKNKYESILTSTSGVTLNDVTQAKIEVDFLVNDKRHEERQRTLKEMNVWYGHDPIYRLTVTVELENGHIYQEVFRSYT